jgi:hypothetical protein
VSAFLTNLEIFDVQEKALAKRIDELGR